MATDKINTVGKATELGRLFAEQVENKAALDEVNSKINSNNSTVSSDNLYDDAVSFVNETGKVSPARIQRKFNIGYNRAISIMEDMQKSGLISEPDSNGRYTVNENIADIVNLRNEKLKLENKAMNLALEINKLNPEETKNKLKAVNEELTSKSIKEKLSGILKSPEVTANVSKKAELEELTANTT